MRVLLDENVDRKLKQSFDPDHTVVTVRERGWSGKKNGDLLSSAEVEFDVLFTLDTNMRYQQNLPRYDLAVVLVIAVSNKRSVIETAMPEVNELLPEVQPGLLYVVATQPAAVSSRKSGGRQRFQPISAESGMGAKRAGRQFCHTSSPSASRAVLSESSPLGVQKA